LFGKKYAIVHGDGFNINTLAKDLSSMTKNFYEAIFIGHIHHVFVEEQNGTLVISNGTFAGNDEYANRINKTSVPSQNIFIVSENGIEDIKTIKLNIV
jgi:predicted phosphodiesterase